MPFVSYYYIIEFSTNADPFEHLNTSGHLSKYWVHPQVHRFRHLYSLCWTFLSAKLPRILSALEMLFSCIESAVGLHSETSGLPRLAGLQSCRKPLWSYPTLLQDEKCSSVGYFVVLLLKIESDKYNPPIPVLAACLHINRYQELFLKNIRVKCERDFLLIPEKS